MPAESEDQREGLVQIGVPCQLEAFPAQLDAGPPSREEPWSWYLLRRSRRLLAKIGTRLPRLGPRATATPDQEPAEPGARPVKDLPPPPLQAGDWVRVRSAQDIRETLDAQGSYRGCGFGLGMYGLCGEELRVAKVVRRFYDEARGRMLKASNMVLLAGVYCDGSSCLDTRGCDRMCSYFWRTEWLEKVEAPRSEAAGRDAPLKPALLPGAPSP
ncbi:MAG: hypothetical protein A2V77_16185 [Anaeromyxobacter sp. RBG_16_69_14]|nr:MAG: hypothetical protein A2V77_16185 [Anaeromyxobacter sp. RBG_16_69_14]